MVGDAFGAALSDPWQPQADRPMAVAGGASSPFESTYSQLLGLTPKASGGVPAVGRPPVLPGMNGLPVAATPPAAGPGVQSTSGTAQARQGGFGQ